MKNLYNTINQNLKAGLQVVVKDLEDNQYCTISNSKDCNGNYGYSGWWKSIEEAKQYIVDCYGYSKEYWNNLDIEIVEVFRPEYEPLEVGDKVRLLDSIKNAEDWNELEEDFPDMTGEIEECCIGVDGTNYIIKGWLISHEYLAPFNEVKEDNIALEAIKLLEERGYRIIRFN